MYLCIAFERKRSCKRVLERWQSGLAAQLMRFQLYESFRIQPTAIHHDREINLLEISQEENWNEP